MLLDDRLRAELLRFVYGRERWPGRGCVWCPPADVFQTAKSLIVRLEVAGMSREDFNITLEERRLAITGERRDTVSKRAYHVMAVPFGRFTTEIELPNLEYDVDAVSAAYENGFLTIEIPVRKGEGRVVKIK